jgi:hypothetical protein
MDRAQKFAFGVAMAGLVISGLVAIYGNWIVASIIAIVSVGGPSAATVLARFVDRKMPTPKGEE